MRLKLPFFRLHWLFLTSLVIGVVGLFAPRYIRALDFVDAAYETTLITGVAYLLLLALAIAKHHFRGLWLLLPLPLLLYWPLGFMALDYACKHNANACP